MPAVSDDEQVVHAVVRGLHPAGELPEADRLDAFHGAGEPALDHGTADLDGPLAQQPAQLRVVGAGVRLARRVHHLAVAVEVLPQPGQLGARPGPLRGRAAGERARGEQGVGGMALQLDE
ncbi:hypothetical protein BJF90_43140 [Pseudonocardia sp. CNS-004]|nr:hypothetical protein BJF90_43140 [Pseudonocardia sp. CNS-004]